jgi:hypothetical protein
MEAETNQIKPGDYVEFHIDGCGTARGTVVELGNPRSDIFHNLAKVRFARTWGKKDEALAWLETKSLRIAKNNS